MKRLFALICSALTLNVAHSQSLEHARGELQNENFVKARKEFRALYNTSQSPVAAFYLGNVYLRMGQADSAYVFYQKATAATDAYGHLAHARLAVMAGKDTNEVKTHINKAFSASKHRNAEIFFQAGFLAYQPEPANVEAYIRYVDMARQLEPTNIYYGLMLGDLYLAQAATDRKAGGRAMTQYEEALALDSNNVLTNMRIGRLYYSATNYEYAIRFLEKANKINPDISVLHKELGELYFLTKDYEKATSEYKKYVDMNENDSRAKAVYGGFLFQLKEYDKAIDEVNEFLKTDSTNYIFHRILAYSYYEKKKPMEAQQSMDKFWKYVGMNKIIGLDLGYAGRIASANGDTANANKYFKLAVEKDTANADLRSEYAKALFFSKRYQESIEQYKIRKAMERPMFSLDYYYLGRAYYSFGDYVNADTTFGDFVRLQPKSPDGYLWRGNSMLMLEDQENLKGLASVHYLKFIEMASTDVDRNKSNMIKAYNYLAYVALTSNDKAKAKEYFNKILEIDPDNKEATKEIEMLSNKK